MTTIYESESDLPEHLQTLLDAARRHQHEWINNIEGDSLSAQHKQMTIFGPFGGPVRHARDQLVEVQSRARSQFKSGTGTVQLIRAIEAGDLVILVLSETSEVMFVGRDEPHTWSLRITEAYLDVNGTWRRIHRHADPLTKLRGLAETLALLE